MGERKSIDDIILESFLDRATKTEPAQRLDARDGPGTARDCITTALTVVDHDIDFPGDSFWDLFDPQTGAIAMRQMYGDSAAAKAKESADSAKKDNRETDYRFWIAVFARINSWDKGVENEQTATA